MNSTHLGQAWSVGALCLAISDALQARFNPVLVRGEISGFSQAASGHCYFTLKDDHGQLRVAMFKRAAAGLSFRPQDGQQVEISGQLNVYEQRGELQLVAQSMTQVGLGNLLEAFIRLKEKLAAAGLFDADRKRIVSAHPRGIGVVTSLGAAAWQDVTATFKRRIPHLPVVLSPALVQGALAPESLILALRRLYALIQTGQIHIDVILLVRGGGSLEDLWSFNDEQLAYAICDSPVPIISGVGHESDFSIADFVADLRAPTPTAAAELCASALEQDRSDLASRALRFQELMERGLQRQAQYLDMAARRLLEPTAELYKQKERLTAQGVRLNRAVSNRAQGYQHSLEQMRNQLHLLHPQQVLNRGFAWVSDASGSVVTDALQLTPAQKLKVHLARGTVDVRVSAERQAEFFEPNSQTL